MTSEVIHRKTIVTMELQRVAEGNVIDEFTLPIEIRQPSEAAFLQAHRILLEEKENRLAKFRREEAEAAPMLPQPVSGPGEEAQANSKPPEEMAEAAHLAAHAAGEPHEHH